MSVSQVQLANVLGLFWEQEAQGGCIKTQKVEISLCERAKCLLKMSDIKMGIFQMTAGRVKLKGLDTLSA